MSDAFSRWDFRRTSCTRGHGREAQSKRTVIDKIGASVFPTLGDELILSYGANKYDVHLWNATAQ